MLLLCAIVFEPKTCFKDESLKIATLIETGGYTYHPTIFFENQNTVCIFAYCYF